RDGAINAAAAERDRIIRLIEDETVPQIRRLVAAAEEAQERSRQTAVVDSNRKLKAKMEAEAGDGDREWRRLQNAIQGLGWLEKSLLETLPIPGLQVIEGGLYFDEIPFERLN